MRLFSKLNYIFIPIFALLMFSCLNAQTVGTTTADILKINEGARPAAMGGAYTAMGEDAYSLNYNPAGLSYVRASQLVFLHLISLADIQYEYLTFATAWGTENVLAINGTYRYSPPIDNQNGNPPVNADDLLGSISYARKFSSNFRAGATIKFLKSDLASYSASAIAFDLGVVLDRLPYGTRIGLSIQNLGTSMTFNPASSTSDPLPLFIRFGVGTHQVIDKDKDLNIGLEVFKPSDQDIKLGIGAEAWLFPELFAVRGGYKFETLGSFYGGNNPTTGKAYPGVPNVFQNYTLGCTLTRKIEGDDFSIDIAYNPADFTSTIQDTFFFALNFKFNQLRIF
jgi:hypothetical protein